MAVESTCCRGICEIIGAGVVAGSALIAAGTWNCGAARQRTNQPRNIVAVSYKLQSSHGRENTQCKHETGRDAALGRPVGAARRPYHFRSRTYCPSGVVTSVPGGGVNSKFDAGTVARVWFEYAVTIRSPFGSSISVRSTRKLSLICRSSF